MNRPLPPNPFVGLRSFERADSLYYFGRDTQVQTLLSSLHQSRFLAVVGSSGCGKSSLIRAGLIPALEAGFLVQDRDRWRIATCKPGETPLGRLAEALLAATGQDQNPDAVTRLADRLLDEGVEAALETLGTTLEDHQSNLLLLVDQFEELFRFGDPAGTEKTTRYAEAEAFVARLLQLAARDGLPVYCVITMRSDFIGDCDVFNGLPEAINRGQFLVPRLTRAQRREAITGPVRLTGGQIAPRLVDRLLNERLDTRDDLPILQHVLMRCWDVWTTRTQAPPSPPLPLGGGRKSSAGVSPASKNAGGDACATLHGWAFTTLFLGEGLGERVEQSLSGPIDIDHYEQVHTIHGALNRHAQEALEELSPEDQDLARRIFQALTELDPSNRRIRRPTRLSALCDITGASEPRLRRVIEGFRRGGRNFLVLSGDQDPMVDISHESLIRQWDSLRTWVDQEAEAAETYRRLAETASRHSDAEPRYYRDAELQEAIAWQRQQQPTPAWAERYRADLDPALGFLRKSRLIRIEEHRERRRARAERERLLREKAELAQRQAEQDRRARRTARNWSLILGVLAILMLILAGYAWQLRDQAWEKTYAAEAAEQASQQQLLKANVNLARAHEEKAIALLERAFATKSTGDYQQALLQALQAQRQPIQGQPGLQQNGLDRLTAPRIVHAFPERWRSPTPRLGSAAKDLAWSPDGERIATAQSDGGIRLWDTATGEPLRILTGHKKSVTSVDFSPDGRLLASASDDRTVRLWDPATGELVRTLTGHENQVTSVAFSPDGNLLASTSDKSGSDGTIRLWDLATGKLVRTLTGHKNGVIDLAFSPDGGLLASASWDRTIHLWDPATGQSVDTLTGHEHRVILV